LRLLSAVTVRWHLSTGGERWQVLEGRWTDGIGDALVMRSARDDPSLAAEDFTGDPSLVVDGA
jgi:hypothetical protein